jgi:hypothetical protein
MGQGVGAVLASVSKIGGEWCLGETFSDRRAYPLRCIRLISYFHTCTFPVFLAAVHTLCLQQRVQYHFHVSIASNSSQKMNHRLISLNSAKQNLVSPDPAPPPRSSAEPGPKLPQPPPPNPLPPSKTSPTVLHAVQHAQFHRPIRPPSHRTHTHADHAHLALLDRRRRLGRQRRAARRLRRARPEAARHGRGQAGQLEDGGALPRETSPRPVPRARSIRSGTAWHCKNTWANE